MKLNLDLKEKPISEQIGQYDPDKARYPSLTFETEQEHDLPASGTMTIKFKKTRSTEEEQNGKVMYRCTIDVQKIVSVEGGKGQSKAEEEESPEEGAGESKEEETAEDGADEESDTERSPAVASVLKKKGKKAPRSPAVASVLGQSDY